MPTLNTDVQSRLTRLSIRNGTTDEHNQQIRQGVKGPHPLPLFCFLVVFFFFFCCYRTCL